MKLKVVLLLFLASTSYIGASTVYDLALKSLIYSNDTKNAYELAKKIIKKDPNNLKYREYLADLALWNSDSSEALKNYYWLYRRGKTSFEDRVIELSLGLKRFDIATEVLEKRFKRKKDIDSFKKLLGIYEYEGEYTKAIGLIEKRRDFFGDYRDFFKKLSKFYILNNRVDKLVAIKDDYFIKYGEVPTEVALYLSKYYLSRGEVKQAYAALLEAKDDKNLYYLERVAEFSRYLGDKNRYKEVLKKIIKKKEAPLWHKATLAELYLADGEYFKAFKLSEELILKDKQEQYLYLYVASLYKHDIWDERVLQTLLSIQNRVSKSSMYWIALAEMYHKRGNNDKADKVYKEGILKTGYSLDLVRSYLWFLIDIKDIKELERALNSIVDESEIEDSLMLAILLTLRKSDKALQYVKRAISNNPDSFTFKLLYSDLLYTIGKFEESENIRFKTYLSMRESVSRKPMLLDDQDFFFDYLRVAFFYESYTEIEKLLIDAKEKFEFNDYLLSKVNFSILQKEYDLAQFYINRFTVKR